MQPGNKTLSYKTDRPILKKRTFWASLSYNLGQPVLITRTFWPIFRLSLSGFLGHYRDLTTSPLFFWASCVLLWQASPDFPHQSPAKGAKNGTHIPHL